MIKKVAAVFLLFALSSTLLVLVLAAVEQSSPYNEQYSVAAFDVSPAVNAINSSAVISLTATGFEPGVLTDKVGTEVEWRNTTSQTVYLQSGEPGNEVYLPIVVNAAGDASDGPALFEEQSSEKSHVLGESFGGELRAGGIFTHVFSTVGEHPYYLRSAPETRGRVVVYTPPPNPEEIAPPVDSGVVTNLNTATEFIYTGDNPIQTGVVSDTIDARQVAVLRGRVLKPDNNPFPGVKITILDHPEFGYTYSRDDGLFDMVVNGGGLITINYDRQGSLPAQRQMDVPWQTYAWAPDVVLIPLDTNVTTVDLNQTAEDFVVVQGSVSVDGRGKRQSTLLFPQGIAAELVLPGGITQTITTLDVRATEYSVGENGVAAMPAELPPGVGFTYAAELSVDEALQAGAQAVQFDQPLINYVENFLGFATGDEVPAYTYDKDQAHWVPSPNGRVIEILGITSGMADLDTDGDGLVDDPATLAALGINDAERRRLASTYSAGVTLWRVSLSHFSTVDYNILMNYPNKY